ncbi:MAG: polysaccharide deacetylase family protein [Candidatus Gastranaerophilales bacterium]|nr:polysaccharide deacetylase family protein [Candidatus Gastranaerophilales bacterium]
MSKKTAAILGMVILVGLLLFCMRGNKLWENRTALGHAAAFGTAISKVSDVSETPVEEVKKIAITFDDGPHPHYTEQLLDGLQERGVVATFFVTGEHAQLHPDIILRMQEEGHLIGNHTYSHIQLTSSNREKFKEELIATNEVIEEITGVEVEYVRPPYGSWDKSFESELNMFPVLWTVDPLDWCSGNASCIVEKIVSKAGENDIILMHDYYDTSVTAALKAIDKLKEEGYTFVTVEEILFD